MNKDYAHFMQDDLISRQDAIEAFGLSEKTRKYGGDHSGYNTMMLYEIQDVLESLPSAPDSRQRGEWIYHKNTMSCVRWSKWECSKCHKKQEYKTDYCPSCGADMRGEEE